MVVVLMTFEIISMNDGRKMYFILAARFFGDVEKAKQNNNKEKVIAEKRPSLRGYHNGGGRLVSNRQHQTQLQVLPCGVATKI